MQRIVFCPLKRINSPMLPERAADIEAIACDGESCAAFLNAEGTGARCAFFRSPHEVTVELQQIENALRAIAEAIGKNEAQGF